MCFASGWKRLWSLIRILLPRNMLFMWTPLDFLCMYYAILEVFCIFFNVIYHNYDVTICKLPMFCWLVNNFVYLPVNRLYKHIHTRLSKIFDTCKTSKTNVLGNNSLCFIQGSSNSHAIKKKDELERVAKSNR